MSKTKKAKVPSQRDMALRMLIERKGAGAGKHHTRERDVLKGMRRKGKHPMRFEENPFHKPGQDQYGRVCFYIYNDDGSQVVGPTGPKFCYTVEKAEEMVKKAEAAGKRVSPSAVSPGPRVAPAASTAPLPAAPPPVPPQASSPGLTILESKFEQLRPILNHHLVMSYLASIRSMGMRTPEQAAQHAPKVQGIAARKKYAVIHSGTATNRASGQKQIIPEFVVNMETMEISRSDPNGQPRDMWNFGTIDEVIARGVTLKPRQNPKGWV